MTSDRWIQCSRVGLEVKIYDTPAGGICASQGTFSSVNSWIISLANAKSLFKINFGHINFICQPIFKLLAGPVATN